MTTRMQIIQKAPAGHLFAPDVFDSQIGKTVPLEYEGRQLDSCKILKAEVSSDGTEILLTLELPGNGGDR